MKKVKWLMVVVVSMLCAVAIAGDPNILVPEAVNTDPEIVVPEEVVSTDPDIKAPEAVSDVGCITAPEVAIADPEIKSPEAVTSDITVMAPEAISTDPDFMSPVVISASPDGRIVTVSFYMVNVDRNPRTDKYEPVKDADIWGWVNDPDFLTTFQQMYWSFPQGVRNRIRIMSQDPRWDEARDIYDKREAERTRK